MTPASATPAAVPAKVGAAHPCERCWGSAPTHLIPHVCDPITLERYEIQCCNECGLGWTSPAPADLDRYYRQRYYGRRHWITSAYCLWRRIRVVNLTFGGVRQHTILDVGCGDGAFLDKARQLGWKVTGTEINVTPTALAGIPVASSLAEIQESFDCITCWHVLEHLRQPVGSLREMRSRLLPAGALVLSVPDAGGWQARLFGRHWFHRDVPRHLFHFNLRSLQKTLETAGFRVTTVWHHELEYDLFGWIQSALNAMLKQPNVLFDFLTGQARRASGAAVAFSVGFAALMFPLAFALTVVSTLAGEGGTLIVAARPVSEPAESPQA